MTKKILYLVQSRNHLVEQHYQLESSIADVIILTFEAEIKQENCLYLPNSNWHQGRNALYEKAKSLAHRYDFYIFLDDDITFISGSYKKFEQDLIRTNADFMVPNYQRFPGANYQLWLNKFAKIHYSKLIDFDLCYMALSQKLFFNEKILPQNQRFITKNFFSPNVIFKIYLFSLVAEDRLLRNDSIIIDNLLHAQHYPWEISKPVLWNKYLIQYLSADKTIKDVTHIYRKHFTEEFIFGNVPYEWLTNVFLRKGHFLLIEALRIYLAFKYIINNFCFDKTVVNSHQK